VHFFAAISPESFTEVENQVRLQTTQFSGKEGDIFAQGDKLRLVPEFSQSRGNGASFLLGTFFGNAINLFTTRG